MNQTTFKMTLFDDESVVEKQTVCSNMEVMFDDARNTVPDDYYKLIEDLKLGSTVRITLEVLP